ncbi:MAG: DNA polymerase/3'-5' exonuclease PolX [Candidatus Nealsonbacteria bacterium]|nr:DNA polymerase/3'-5' exonuclease PolX [Candidatus Nealsonbacteria bacterium]
MKNQELAKIFYEIADYLRMENVAFKPFAYQRVAMSLESLEEGVEKVYREGGIKALEKIPGVGKNIAEKIEEYLKTGKIKSYDDLKKKMPIDLEELLAVEGLGPRKTKTLYQKLGIKNLKELEKAAKGHKIASLFGFKEKTEKNILEGIAFLKKSKGRFLLGEILPEVKEIITKLKTLKEVEQISVAGSVRRMKETIGDVDILITTKNPKKVMDFFVSLPGIVKVWVKGTTKSSIRLEQGFDVDLRTVHNKSYGSALQYFTGSKEHNIATRRLAIEKGLKLNEYGVFKGKKMIAGWNEAGVYRVLGLPWIEPELREDQGEIEKALKKELPKIIGYDEIRGDLHCHSDWDGGENSIEETAKTAMAMGYEYIGISDHTKYLKIENGLDEKKLESQRKEIGRLNEKLKKENKKFRILQGCETNILKDGSADIKDEALAKLDYVIAGVHSSFKMEKDEMTERIINAIKNPNIDIISHPTGRILKKRDEYLVDFDKVLKAAKEHNKILEINSWPERLDLNDQRIRMAKEAKVKMVINTDSHSKGHLRFIELGIAQARRGWAEKEDIINSQPIEKLLKFFK